MNDALKSWLLKRQEDILANSCQSEKVNSFYYSIIHKVTTHFICAILVVIKCKKAE